MGTIHTNTLKQSATVRRTEYSEAGNVAENAGLKVVSVNPNGTSQECSNCGQKVKKPLSQRTHDCPLCQVSLCRDLNASINIKNRGALGLKAQSMSYGGVSEKPTL